MRPLATALSRHHAARYLSVGALVTVVNNLLLIGGDRAGLGYAALMALTWLVGGSLGYVLHARHTFRQRHGWAAYTRFMGGVALGVPLAWALLWLLHSVLALPMWLAAPLATVAMLAYNYAAARLAILWRRWRKLDAAAPGR